MEFSRREAEKSTGKERNASDMGMRLPMLIVVFLAGDMAMGDTVGLGDAKAAKKDEFYTQRVDIENELRHYKAHFKGKIVLCNCDDPRQSEFFKYFAENFEHLGLKRLIATCYKSQDRDLFSHGDCERAICQIYEGDKNGNMVVDDDEIGVRELKGDGDFRSEECIEILKQADVVVTNPPFSLFREYVAQLFKYGKDFLIIGNVNAITYKEFFPMIRDNKVWMGASIHSGDRKFCVPDSYPLNAAGCGIDENGRKFIRVKGVRWWTNLDYPQRHEKLPLYKKYSDAEFPKYDNYDAINVNNTSDIPYDYDGVMGVPITFLDKYNPEQFEIIGISKTWFGGACKIYPEQIEVGKNGNRKKVGKLNDGAVLALNSEPVGKTYYLVDCKPYQQLYARIFIRRRKAQ